MHRYFFTTKDSFINSGSNSITGEDFKDKNTGQDEILELKKVFADRTFSYQTMQMKLEGIKQSVLLKIFLSYRLMFVTTLLVSYRS